MVHQPGFNTPYQIKLRWTQKTHSMTLQQSFLAVVFGFWSGGPYHTLLKQLVFEAFERHWFYGSHAAFQSIRLQTLKIRSMGFVKEMVKTEGNGFSGLIHLLFHNFLCSDITFSCNSASSTAFGIPKISFKMTEALSIYCKQL